MPQKCSNEELDLRIEIDTYVRDLQASIRRFPLDVDCSTEVEQHEARLLVEEMLDSMQELEESSSLLERLADLSSEGLLLCGAIKVTVRLMSDTLATITASLDSNRQAA